MSNQPKAVQKQLLEYQILFLDVRIQFWKDKEKEFENGTGAACGLKNYVRAHMISVCQIKQRQFHQEMIGLRKRLQEL